MLEWLQNALPTVLVLAVLLAIVAVAVISVVRDKQKGKHSCGGNCGACPMSGSCHNHK